MFSGYFKPYFQEYLDAQSFDQKAITATSSASPVIISTSYAKVLVVIRKLTNKSSLCDKGYSCLSLIVPRLFSVCLVCISLFYLSLGLGVVFTTSHMLCNKSNMS